MLALPQWSFGRDKGLLREFREILDAFDMLVHDLRSDIDQNRTVAAFSGDPIRVFEAMERLCLAALPRIDLQRHLGSYPRIGALDSAPFIRLPDDDGILPELVLHRYLDRFAWMLAEVYGLPVFLCEHSDRGRPEGEIPDLFRKGFGALLERKLDPDYGPTRAHPHLGVAVVGEREWALQGAVNLATSDLTAARTLTKSIRELRREGDPRFLGVSALALALASRNQTQVSMILTLPDLTAFDPVLEWIRIEVSKLDVSMAGADLIGPIRRRDVAGASRLAIGPGQVVDG